MQCGNKNYLQFHHVVPNTKLFKGLYGDERIQSEENGVLCCQDCHSKHNLWDTEKRKELKSKWKVYLNSKLNGKNR